MSKITKEEWQTIEEALNYLYPPVALLCDGCVITLGMVRDKQQLKISVRVDGRISCKWLAFGEKEIAALPPAAKFLSVRHTARTPKKELKKFEEAFGKLYCRERGLYDKVPYTYPAFNSPRAAIRHIKKVSNETHRLCREGA